MFMEIYSVETIKNVFKNKFTLVDKPLTVT